PFPWRGIQLGYFSPLTSLADIVQERYTEQFIAPVNTQPIGIRDFIESFIVKQLKLRRLHGLLRLFRDIWHTPPHVSVQFIPLVSLSRDTGFAPAQHKPLEHF